MFRCCIAVNAITPLSKLTRIRFARAQSSVREYADTGPRISETRKAVEQEELPRKELLEKELNNHISSNLDPPPVREYSVAEYEEACATGAKCGGGAASACEAKTIEWDNKLQQNERDTMSDFAQRSGTSDEGSPSVRFRSDFGHDREN